MFGGRYPICIKFEDLPILTAAIAEFNETGRFSPETANNLARAKVNVMRLQEMLKQCHSLKS